MLCCGNTKLVEIESIDDIDDLWNGEILQKVREGFITKKNLPAFCERCELFKILLNNVSYAEGTKKENPTADEHLGKGKYFTRQMPESITLNITNRCNLRCTMCNKFPYTQKELNDEAPLAAIEKIIRKFGPTARYLNLCSDGEFIMHSQYEQIMEVCEEVQEQIGRKILIGVTNGIPLKNQARLERIMRNYHELRFSLETTDADTYRQVRGGDIEVIKDVIRRCVTYVRENNLECRIGVTAVVMKETLPTLETLADFAIDEGLDLFHCQHIIPMADSDVNRRVDSDPQLMALYNTIYEAIEAKMKKNPKVAYFMPQVFDSTEPMSAEDVARISTEAWLKEAEVAPAPEPMN